MLRTLKYLPTALAFVTLLAAPQIWAAEKKADAPATKPATAAKKVSVEEFDKARQEKGAIVLDVRSPEEFAAGHLPGAVNVPVTGKGSEAFEKMVGSIDKSKLVLVHCRSGVRSAKACEKMGAMGFEHLVEMPGGWVAWSEAGKPVEKGSKGGELPAQK